MIRSNGIYAQIEAKLFSVYTSALTDSTSLIFLDNIKTLDYYKESCEDSFA